LSSSSGRSLLRAAATSFACTGLVALIAALTIFKMSNNDIWIHLKLGEVILDTGRVPHNEPFSFTASGREYFAHGWLGGVLLELVYRAAGVNGLIFAKALIVLAACAALYLACRLLRVREWIIYPVFALMLFTASARFVERPLIFTDLFLTIYLLCYFAYRECGRQRAWLYVIPFIHLFWANIHGAHHYGLALLVVLAAAETAAYARAKWLGLAATDAPPARDVAFLWALPPACVLAALVNPYGYHLLVYPFTVLRREVVMRMVYEWQPAIHPSFAASSMFLYYVVWNVVLLGSFLAVRGHDELAGIARIAARTANALLALLWLGFAWEFAMVYQSSPADGPLTLVRHEWLWYGAAALALIANLHRLEFQHVAITALFFASSMLHNRGVTEAVLATLPTLAHNLNVVANRFAARAYRNPPWREPALIAAMGAALFALALYTWRNSYYFRFTPPSKREAGLGVASNMPTGAVNYIAVNRITGRAYSSFPGAAMLIHRMWPQVTVAMDSRDVYSDDLFLEYFRAQSRPEYLAAYLRKWPVDFFLIDYRLTDVTAMVRYFDRSPDWALVYFDDRSLVYVRTSPAFRRSSGATTTN